MQSDLPAANERVRTAVAAAARLRRRRAASARVWRIAPFVATALLGLALVSRWAGWPDALPLGAFAAALLALSVHLVLQFRDRAVSDAVAASIDADARLGGELRSASWFANRSAGDPWAELHIERAADRLQTFDWARLYPPVRARRSRISTLLIVAGALGVAVVLPDRTGAGSDASAHASPPASGSRVAPQSAEALSPELQKLLDDLLAKAESGTLASSSLDPTTNVELRELLDRLSELRDRDALKELARELDTNASQGDAQDLDDLAERARHAAELNAFARKFADSMKTLATNLTEAAKAERADAESARGVSESPREGNAGEASAEGIDEATIQSLKEAPGGAGEAGAVMMSEQNAAAGAATPGFGLGGGSGQMSTDTENTALETALRQELVEANRDTGGANVEAEIRRKTERGEATVTFTRSAAAKSDTSPAAAPPAVPEARRTEVRRYFIRKQ